MQLIKRLLLMPFLFSVLMATQAGFSQAVHFNYNYDSLAKQVPLQKTDAEKIRLLCLLIDGMPDFGTEPTDQVMGYIDQLISINKKKPSSEIQPYFTMQESFRQWRNGDFENALINIKKSIDGFDRQHKIIAPLLMNVRSLHNYLNQQEERFEFYTAKLNYYLVNGPVENTAACYHGIGGYYNYKANYNLAIGNYLKAQSAFKPYFNDFYINEFFAVGTSYLKWGNTDKADFYLKNSLPLSIASRANTDIALNLISLSNLSYKQKKYDQALSYADQAVSYIDRKTDSRKYSIAMICKANTYLAMAKPGLAYPLLMEIKALSDSFHFQLASNDGELENDFGFYKYYQLSNDSKNASRYLLIALEKSVAEKSTLFQLKYLKELASCYENSNPALSMQYINKYFTLSDKLEKEGDKFKVAQYEIEQKESEQDQNITALKQEKAIQAATISQRNTIMWISLMALFLIVVSMVFLYRQFHNNRKTLRSLRKTQRQLIMAEKMASLGELTAGIAHEIQNPLNFVNNFSEVNTELIDELSEEADKGNLDEVKTIAKDIKENEQKINHHGKRADAIVKGMLQHSRSSSGVKEPTDINALCDEYLRLSYHGIRAKDKSFNATIKTDFDNSLSADEAGIGNINIIPQDIGRVILNLLTNAFYAVDEKKKVSTEVTPFEKVSPLYEPTVSISTKRISDKVEIKVTDNGKGIPEKVLDKIFQPFFTTKPTGQGTGLGLSLSYDIVKAHGGEIKVETKEGAGSTFIIQIPN